MKILGLLLVLVVAAIAVTAARGGHELPVYPSFYPDRIELRRIAPEQAADALRAAKIHAYIGAMSLFSSDQSQPLRAIASLGRFVLVRVNPASSFANDDASACALVKVVIGELARLGRGLVPHPYPVTPFHGDYLYHADLAEAAKARLSRHEKDALLPPLDAIKIKVDEALAHTYSEWPTKTAGWDAEIVSVDAAQLMASAMIALNGLNGPPWLKAGWFQATQLLAEAVIEPATRERAEGDRAKLVSGDFGDLADRINLERDLVTSLIAQCREVVAGYTLKYEYVNDDYSAGIENIDVDSIAGLHSPMFLRTVKLKDFPWNGLLSVGLNSGPQSAFNPIAGMTDDFGRLIWFAIGDPALVPAPNDSGWMLNRIADVGANIPR